MHDRMPHAMKAMRFPTDAETLWESLEWLYAYMPALRGVGHKASAQQIQECGGIPSVLLKKERGDFSGVNAKRRMIKL